MKEVELLEDVGNVKINIMPKKKKKGKGLKSACWKGYEAIGMKTKNGKKVPNCVPKKRKK